MIVKSRVLFPSLVSAALAFGLVIPSAEAQVNDETLTNAYSHIQKFEKLAHKSWPNFQADLNRPILLVDSHDSEIYAFRFHPKRSEKWSQRIINGETVYVKEIDEEDPSRITNGDIDLSLKQQSYENQAVLAFYVDDMSLYGIDELELGSQYLLEYEHYYSPRADWRHQQLKNLRSSFSSYKRPEVLAWLIEEVNLANQFQMNPGEQAYRDYMAAAQKRRSMMTREERAAEDAFGIICMPIFKSIMLTDPEYIIGSDIADTKDFLALDYQIEASFNFSRLAFLGLERQQFPWETAYASMNKTMSQIVLDALNISNKEIDQRINKIASSSEFKEISSQAQLLASDEQFQDQDVIKQYDADNGIELVLKASAPATYIDAPHKDNLIYTNSNWAYLYNPFADLNRGSRVEIMLEGTVGILGENLRSFKMGTSGSFLLDALEQPNDYTFYFKFPAATAVYVNGESTDAKTLLDLSRSNHPFDSKEVFDIEFINGDQMLLINSWMGYRIFTDQGRLIIELKDSLFDATSKKQFNSARFTSKLKSKLDHKKLKESGSAHLALFKKFLRHEHK